MLLLVLIRTVLFRVKSIEELRLVPPGHNTLKGGYFWEEMQD